VKGNVITDQIAIHITVYRIVVKATDENKNNGAEHNIDSHASTLHRSTAGLTDCAEKP